MHFHVSRTAFTGKSHLYWFCRLVNTDLFAELSQRTQDGFNYCQRTTNTSPRVFVNRTAYTRYLAVNLLNVKTVEVRIFRGNMEENRIRKNAEAVIAAVEFCRTR